MKILYISGMYPNPTYPQKGIFCHEQVKALKKIGVEVDVIVPMTIYDKEYTTKVWEYEGITIRYIRYLKYPGVKYFETIGKALYFSLLHAHIDFKQYDVFHADAPLPTGDAARRLSRKFGIPYVVHGHGLDVFLGESYAEYKNCETIIDMSVKVYAQADAVIGVSQKVLDKIQIRTDVSEKGYVVYNGVDTDKFVPKDKESDVFIITTIGNLIPLKGHKYTLRAVKKLVDSGYKNLQLKIAGRGELEAPLKQFTTEFGIDDYVQFLGYIAYDDIVKLLQTSDVFVLPSYYEALGCVYLEAMACGVPAIGCNGNGIDEVITNGKNGFLVDAKNVEQIVECLTVLLDRDLCRRIGEEARKTVVEQYQWIDSAQTLLSIYQNTIHAEKKEKN